MLPNACVNPHLNPRSTPTNVYELAIAFTALLPEVVDAPDRVEVDEGAPVDGAGDNVGASMLILVSIILIYHGQPPYSPSLGNIQIAGHIQSLRKNTGTRKRACPLGTFALTSSFQYRILALRWVLSP